MKRFLTSLFLFLPLTFAFGQQKIEPYDGTSDDKWYDDQFTNIDDGRKHRILFCTEFDHENLCIIDVKLLPQQSSQNKYFDCSGCRESVIEFENILLHKMYGVSITEENIQDDELLINENNIGIHPIPHPIVQSTITIRCKDFQSKLIQCDETLGLRL